MFTLAIVLAVTAGILIVSAFIAYDGMNFMLIGIAFLVGAAVFGALGAIAQEKIEHAEFMTQCLQDRKEYECVAMWRAGESHTQVMPMPIVVGR